MFHQTTVKTAVIAVAVLFVSHMATGQVVVEDTNIQSEPSPFLPVTSTVQQLTIFQTVDSGAAGDSTDVLFSAQFAPTILPIPPVPPAADLTGVSLALDEGADLYVAEAGELFSLNTIQAGNFQPLIVDGVFSSDIIPFGDFFLAVATTGTDGGFPAPGADRDVFGWAKFNIDNQLNITLLDNAVAYGTGNIIVGQNAFAIPEPCSGIALATLFGMGYARRRRG